MMAIASLIASEFYTEGPAVDGEGNVYFTTLTGGKVMKLDRDGNSSVWAESACPNGQRILSNGDHLVCDSQLAKVIRFDASGKKMADAASGRCGDVLIRTPNDLAVDDGSGFYFTDSVRHTGMVYFFGDDGSRVVVASGLDYPNGICLSLDKSRLFVAESYKNRILVIELQDPGIPARGPEGFCQLPWNANGVATGNLPDGIMTDSDDRIWVAHYGMQAVQVISSQGKLVKTYDTGIPLTSNLCFTKDGSELIVTGGRAEPGPGNVHKLFLQES